MLDLLVYIGFGLEYLINFKSGRSPTTCDNEKGVKGKFVKLLKKIFLWSIKEKTLK